MEVRGQPWVGGPQELSTLFFQTASLTGLELVVLASLVLPASPRDSPVSAFPRVYTIVCFLKVGAGD